MSGGLSYEDRWEQYAAAGLTPHPILDAPRNPYPGHAPVRVVRKIAQAIATAVLIVAAVVGADLVARMLGAR